jgi:hypothetical protein
MGSVKTFPGIVTAVVGRCEATLDQRDLDADVLATMYREAQEKSRQFAEEEGCTVEWSRIWNIEPEPFHPELIDSARRPSRDGGALAPHALRPAARRRRSLPRRHPHRDDVCAIAQGISHNKIEDTREDHEKVGRAMSVIETATPAIVSHWINGKPEAATSGRSGIVANPATGQTIAEVGFASVADVDRAVAAPRLRLAIGAPRPYRAALRSCSACAT